MKRTLAHILPAIALVVAGCTVPQGAPRADMAPAAITPAPAPPASGSGLPLREPTVAKAPDDAARLLAEGSWIREGPDYIWAPATYIANPDLLTVWGDKWGFSASFRWLLAFLQRHPPWHQGGPPPQS